MLGSLEQKKKIAQTWFERLRDDVCISFEACEDEVSDADTIEALAKGSFERSSWKRPIITTTLAQKMLWLKKIVLRFHSIGI